MIQNRLVKIYNILNTELLEAPPEDCISEIENNMYADMQNLKESLTDYFLDEILKTKKHFEYTECKMIGLNKYLYVFENEKDFKTAYKELGKIGEVKEIFLNNEWGLEFKQNKRIIDENEEFSDLSKEYIENRLEKYYGIPITICDENLSQIHNEIGDLGVSIYKEYYDWYRENGMYEYTDYIDSFCYGKIDEIKSYLDEVINFTENDKEMDNENKLLVIEQAKKYQEQLSEYERMKEEELLQE